MKSVDNMIRYLSGELTRDEEERLEQEISTDKQLKEEFDKVSMAYNLIRTQLKLKDEKDFRDRLNQVMESSSTDTYQLKQKKRRLWIYLVPLAASLALILLVILMKTSPEKIYADFFHPAKDPVILAYCQETRGDAGPAVMLYAKGSFAASMDNTGMQLSMDPDNHHALLFHLLSALEIDREQEVLSMLDSTTAEPGNVLDQSITWYHALALIKAGQAEEAARLLEELKTQHGPYRTNAHKLQKMLIK